MARILVADDDQSMCDALAIILGKAGYEVCTVNDGASAIEAFKRGPWDLLVIDVVMPKVDGFEVAEAVRAVDETVPMLILSSKGDIVDKKSGFRAGADDYVVKPFDTEELLLRVEALVRRGKVARGVEQPAAKVPPRVIHVGDLTVDFARYEVSVAGRVASLTPKEFQMLALMAENPGKVFTNEELIAGVWGEEYTEGSISIPVYVRHIRMKIEEDPSSPVYLKTVWRFGYQLCPGE